MGRPGLTQNRKFRRLSLTLGGDAIARGHLELMWDSAYESGDEVLGDGIDVELAAGWRGEGGVLVTAMVKTGFLDVLPAEDGEVFVIHDFWHHAPAYVRKRRTREDERRSKVDPCRSTDRPVTSQSLDTDDKTAPLPHPHPHPKETTTALPTDVGSVAEVAPPKEKKRPKPRGRDFSIQALAMTQDQQAEFDRLWNCYPKLGWDFRSRKEQPRRINYAEAAKRYKEILDYTDVRRSDGSRITPADLSDAMVAWVASRWAEAKRQGLPAPCIPCIGNLLSSVEGEKNHWKEALLTHFDAIPEAS